MFVVAPAIYLSRLHEWVCLVSYSARRLFIFGDTNTLNVALRDPKVNRTRGELTHDGTRKFDDSGRVCKKGRG